ncbi:hypothetical protein QUF72_05885, partial [Desulfobacterales bacterium HSG2]|nr:hypothetical protein [Desulfobacterales bacterium HSG2]
MFQSDRNDMAGQMGHTQKRRCSPPPVIPGRTEKMGHFFSSDPESTIEVRKCPCFNLTEMTWRGRWDTPKKNGGAPPPVIPGKTEKMGHFFSSDPESTIEVRKCPCFNLTEMTWRGRWDTPKNGGAPSACHSGQN